MKKPPLPTPHDLAVNMRSIANRSDREAAILGRAYIELCVERVIVFHTALEDAAADKRLINAMRELDLETKIELAAVIAKLPERLVLRLHAIRNVGNAFAHAWGELAIGVSGYNLSPHIMIPWSEEQFAEMTGLAGWEAGSLVDLDGEPIPDRARAARSSENGGIFFWVPIRPEGDIVPREAFNHAVWDAAYVLIVRSIGSWSGVERVER